MSVKGISEKLFIGKAEISIITLSAKREAIQYNDMKRIDYKYAEMLNPGFIDFITNKQKRRFKFNVKSNEKIGQTVEYITNFGKGT